MNNVFYKVKVPTIAGTYSLIHTGLTVLKPSFEEYIHHLHKLNLKLSNTEYVQQLTILQSKSKQLAIKLDEVAEVFYLESRDIQSVMLDGDDEYLVEFMSAYGKKDFNKLVDHFNGFKQKYSLLVTDFLSLDESLGREFNDYKSVQNELQFVIDCLNTLETTLRSLDPLLTLIDSLLDTKI